MDVHLHGKIIGMTSDMWVSKESGYICCVSVVTDVSDLKIGTTL